MLLEDRLRALGDALDIDADAHQHLPDAVLARLDEEPPRAVMPLLRVAAALVVVVALVVAAVPSSRRAVADWLGFDGVDIERRPGPPAASEPDPFDGPAPGDGGDDGVDPAATVGTVVDVGGDEVLVSAFVGSLDNPAIGKTVGDGTDVRQVDVGGSIGVWIDGAPHEVSFLDEQGEIVFERFAGNTLLWQDGPLIRRVEGFDSLADAIAYAEQNGT